MVKSRGKEDYLLIYGEDIKNLARVFSKNVFLSFSLLYFLSLYVFLWRVVEGMLLVSGLASVRKIG